MRDQSDRFGGAFLAGAWIVFLSLSSVVFSWALACAAPLAAIAALGGIHLSRRLALVLAFTAWCANQAVGFGLLHYPTDPTTIAWGVAIGIATLAAAEIARAAALGLRTAPRWTRSVAAFLGAFIGYEGVLYAAGLVLASGDDAFSLQTVAFVFGTNLIGFVGLEALRRVAVLLHVITTPAPAFAR
jgi:hypothetical protein